MQKDHKFKQRITIIKSFNKNWESCLGSQEIPRVQTFHSRKPLAFKQMHKNINQGTSANRINNESSFNNGKMSFSQPRASINQKQLNLNKNFSSKENNFKEALVIQGRSSFQAKSENHLPVSQFTIQGLRQFAPQISQYKIKDPLKNSYEYQKPQINRNHRSQSFNLPRRKFDINSSFQGICSLQQFCQSQKQSKKTNHQQPIFKRYASDIDQSSYLKNNCKTEVQPENQNLPLKKCNVFPDYSQPKEYFFCIENSIDTPLKNIENLTGDIDQLFAKIQKLKKQCSINDSTNVSSKDTCNPPLVRKKQSTKIKYGLKSQESNFLCEGRVRINKQNILNQKQVIDQSQKLKNYSLQTQNVKIRDFQLGKKIGSGKFGDVFMCMHKKTKTVYALKKILKSTIKQYEMEGQFIKQLKIHYKMTHPNIVKLITHFDDEYHVFLLMEYAEGGSLISKIKISEQKASSVINQLINALEYAHSIDVIHRDIKPQNLVIFFDNTIKLCDFGWATCLANNIMKKSSTFCGTPDYVSPEMKDIGQYSFNVDLWSLGVLTYELVAGFPPFKKEVLQWVKNGVHKPQKWDWNSIAYPKQFSENLKCFINSLLRQNPDDRISLQQCKVMPFISSYRRKTSLTQIDNFE